MSFTQVVHQHTAPEILGNVTFMTSCSSATQPRFNRAVALIHSFQFAGSIAAFDDVLKAEPSCSIAYWGIALSNWGNPFVPGLRSPEQLQRARGRQAGASRRSEDRSRAWLYRGSRASVYRYCENRSADAEAGVRSGNGRSQCGLSRRHRAAIFYALSLAAAAEPTDKTYANQLKAGAILESLFVKYPDHPGLAHYIIHTYDVPPLAARAVLAAKRYGEIAPSTPHALHMPSHTFTRVGDWQASINANVASAMAARSAGQTPDELHATDYLVYAYLQTAQDNSAQHLVESTAQIFSRFDPAISIGGAAGPSAAYFARAAIPARYCLERRAWADAAKLEPLASPYPYTEAITYFRSRPGAAHLKDLPRRVQPSSLWRLVATDSSK